MNSIPEKNTDEYGSYLDDIINELMSIKNTLKKGQMRKENRKEVSNLQGAIKALRHLRNKNNRQVMLLNNREKRLDERYTSDDTRNFLRGFVCDEHRTHDDSSFAYDDIRNFLTGRVSDDDQ